MDLSWLPWKEFGLILIGVVLNELVSNLRRQIRGEHRTDQLDRRVKTMELHTLLKKEHMPVDEVDVLEDTLAARRRRTFELESETASTLKRSDEEGPRPGFAQQEMNRSAAADLDVAQFELRRACLEISFHLEPQELTAFETAQKSWQKFADAAANFEASQFEGGSMQAGIFAAAKTELVIRRIAEIRSGIEDREQSSALT
jgi:uncharacterized protein YecT (DUF1311 family)